MVLAEAPHARLRIAGFGPEEPSLRSLAKKLGVDGRVDFLGAIPQAELPGLYQRAAVFAAPFICTASGDQDGLGLVAIEAIACECPPLLGDLPVLADIFLEDERKFLAQPRDIKGLAGKILNLLADTPSAVASTARIRKRLIGRMGWDAVSQGYAAILRTVIDSGNVPSVGH